MCATRRALTVEKLFSEHCKTEPRTLLFPNSQQHQQHQLATSDHPATQKPRNHVCCSHQEDHPQQVGSGRRRSVQVSILKPTGPLPTGHSVQVCMAS